MSSSLTSTASAFPPRAFSTSVHKGPNSSGVSISTGSALATTESKWNRFIAGLIGTNTAPRREVP
jgi:hypothetical protein